MSHPTKHVCFDEENIQRVCWKQPTLYDTEKAALWYNGLEIQAYRDQVKAIRKNMIIPETWRGLETWVDRDFRNQRRAYIRYVIHLQAECKRQNIYDPSGLGSIAAAHSRAASERAVMYAISDAMEAAQLYRETAELEDEHKMLDSCQIIFRYPPRHQTAIPDPILCDVDVAVARST